MDDIDTYIIARLRDNGRVPFLEMARKLRLSEGAVRKRVGKLLDEGTIKRFTIETSQNAHAIMGITAGPQADLKKTTSLLKNVGANSVYKVNGRFDLIVTLSAETSDTLMDVIEKIRSINGISHTETFTVLKED
jgi:Lrp/AsnC family transcriptional regulator, regulator for asnA, asnC and gidA